MRPTLYFIFLFYFLFSYAQQGNYKFNNFGNRSILLAGNVTGSVEDIGLTIYNPSRLTEVENVGFSFNAKAYQLTNLKLNNVVNGQESKLENTNFDGVATMAGGVFNLFGTRFAYSFLTKTRFNYRFNFSNNVTNDGIIEGFPDVILHNINTGLGTSVKDDWSGLTWAYKLNNKLSLGISLFGSIYEYKGNTDLNHTIKSSNNDVAFYQNISGFRQKSYGLFFKLGANYHFKNFDLGINMNLPYIEIYEEGSFNYKKVIAGAGTENNQYLETFYDNLKSKRKEPFGLSIGAGIPFRKSKLHLNIDYVSGLKKYDKLLIPDLNTGASDLTEVNFKESRKSVVNFGVGAEIYLNEKLKSYVGFTTDFNSFESNANIFDLSNDGTKDINIGEDFYHTSLGIDWKLNWASIILGMTYTQGTADFTSPLNLDINDIYSEDASLSNLKYSRWQVVIGLEIPLFNEKVNDLLNKKESKNKSE